MTDRTTHGWKRLAAGSLSLASLLGGGLFLMRARAQDSTAKSPAPTGKITPWAAMKIATARVPGRALGADYELDEGHWVYGVMVVTGGADRQIKEVEIDPTTGKIGEVENVTPEGEGKELAETLHSALGK